MSKKWRGLLYCLLWYGSIMSGFLFIACPMLPLLLIHPPTFRKCGELLFCCWEMYPTILMEVFGIKVIVTGDHVRPSDSAILVMNHRTRVDWNFLWGAFYQACMPSVAEHKLKFVLKDPIRHIPGPGWIMQMNGFLYITRRWDDDRDRLKRSLDYLVGLKRRSQLLIFPEGTDLTSKSKNRSDAYADARKLTRYRYTMHPKTTGFAYLANHLRRADYLDAVYDLTIGYPDNLPQTELDMIKGNVPREVHFKIRRIDARDLPNDEASLRNWLEERWRHKENELEEFYRHGRFMGYAPWSRSRRAPLRIAFVFWTFLSVLMLVMLFVSSIFQLWALSTALLFVGISIFSTGFNQIEMTWYEKWKSIVTTDRRKIE